MSGPRGGERDPLGVLATERARADTDQRRTTTTDMIAPPGRSCCQSPSTSSGDDHRDQHDAGRLGHDPQQQHRVEVRRRVLEDAGEPAWPRTRPSSSSSSARALENVEMRGVDAGEQSRPRRPATTDDRPATRSSVVIVCGSCRAAAAATRAAAGPGCRTSRGAPRARRGRSPAGAGCRGRSAARSRPALDDPRRAPAARRPAGTARCRRGSPRRLSSSSAPGVSSSIGNDRTSVGPFLPIHCSLSTAIVSGSTSRSVSSVAGVQPHAPHHEPAQAGQARRRRRRLTGLVDASSTHRVRRRS